MKKMKLCILTLLFLSFLLFAAAKPGSPIVIGTVIQLYISLIVTMSILLVPGLLGSQLEAKLDKDSSPSLLCSKKSDWFTLWVELDSAVPGFDECFVDNIKY